LAPAIANRVDDGVEGLAPVPPPRFASSAFDLLNLKQLFEIAEQLLAPAIGDGACDQPSRESRRLAPRSA
jgi:hypothetical protein